MEIIRSLITSFTNAFKGILYVLRSERNARFHLLAALVVLLLGLVLGLADSELAAICFAVLMVFLAEITNTAIEKTLDLIEPADNPRVRIVKDMAAGAVLVAAMMAVIIGLVVFKPYIQEHLWRLG